MSQLLKHPDLKNILLFASTTIFVIACSLKAGELEKPAIHKPFSGIPVDATVLKPAVVNDQLEVTGTILANQQVKIVSELTRKVVKVNVKEGSHVKEGTLLFLLDDADLQAQLERLTQQEKLAQLNERHLKTESALARKRQVRLRMYLAVTLFARFVLPAACRPDWALTLSRASFACQC